MRPYTEVSVTAAAPWRARLLTLCCSHLPADAPRGRSAGFACCAPGSLQTPGRSRVGVLDLGGGSTQITFLPRAQVTSPAACPGGVPALLPLRDLVPVRCHLDLWARDWGVGPPSPACPPLPAPPCLPPGSLAQRGGSSGPFWDRCFPSRPSVAFRAVPSPPTVFVLLFLVLTGRLKFTPLS